MSAPQRPEKPTDLGGSITQKPTHPWRRDRIGKEARTSDAHRKAIAEVKRRARLLKTDK